MCGGRLSSLQCMKGSETFSALYAPYTLCCNSNTAVHNRKGDVFLQVSRSSLQAFCIEQAALILRATHFKLFEQGCRPPVGGGFYPPLGGESAVAEIWPGNR